uniref:ANK_REP_REGION domain-containing protein n=1 Tax=Panagrellus redivivus TaxID=6233 RepID=A0A7E4UX86_PANRE
MDEYERARQERIANAIVDRAEQLRRFDEYDIATPVPQNRKKTIRIVKSLYEAVAREDLTEAEKLLRDKADPNEIGGLGYPALNLCIIKRNEQLVRLLLHYNADVNATDFRLWTPLHVAVATKNIDIARFLIDNGANVLAINEDGNMPYDLIDDTHMDIRDVIETEMAAQNVTQELINAERAKPEQKMLADMKLLHQQGQPLDAKQPDGSSYLHVAAAHGYSDVAAFLLRVGIQPNLRDYDDWTPLHAAANWGQINMVEMLTDYGADVNAKTKSQETPLDLAPDEETATVIQTIMNHSDIQKRKRATFGVRDSRRQSRKKSKSCSPGPLTTPTEGENPFGRGTIRRSLRESSGMTLAKLEAQRERLQLIDGGLIFGRNDKSKKRSTTDKKSPASSSVSEWHRQFDISMTETDAETSGMLSDTEVDAIKESGKPKKGKGCKFLCCVIS